MAKKNSNRKRISGWRRLLAVAGVLCVVGLLVLWFARNAIAGAVFERALPKIASRASAAGVGLIDFQSGRIEVTTPTKARLLKVKTDFDLGSANRGHLRSRFEADELGVSLVGLFPLEVRLEARGFSLRFHPEDLPAGFPFDSFERGAIRSAPLPARDPDAAVKKVLEGLVEMFQSNELERDFNFAGAVKVAVGEGTIEARLYTEELSGGRSRLRFNLGDIRRLAQASGVELADDEMEILSLYPLRVPEMVLIGTQCKSAAVARKAADPTFPEDAFRHITWSYRLTKAFGANFAKQVTDAHETLPNNTDDERAMDYHNNAVARGLAGSGVKEADLERLVLESPDIIRSPEEAAGRSDLRR